MDNVLRWVQKTTWSRSRSCANLPQRNESKIRPPDQLQSRLQQRSRIRGTPPWNAHGQNMRSHSPHNLRGLQSRRPADDEKLQRNSRQHGSLPGALQRTRRKFASSTTSPGTTTQKLTNSRTSVRPEDQYHPAFFLKASAEDPSSYRQQHLKQSWTARTQQTWRRWQQQPHQKAQAPAHPTAQPRQSSKDPSGQNRSSDS